MFHVAHHRDGRSDRYGRPMSISHARVSTRIAVRPSFDRLFQARRAPRDFPLAFLINFAVRWFISILLKLFLLLSLPTQSRGLQSTSDRLLTRHALALQLRNLPGRLRPLLLWCVLWHLILLLGFCPDTVSSSFRNPRSVSSYISKSLWRETAEWLPLSLLNTRTGGTSPPPRDSGPATTYADSPHNAGVALQ